MPTIEQRLTALEAKIVSSSPTEETLPTYLSVNPATGAITATFTGNVVVTEGQTATSGVGFIQASALAWVSPTGVFQAFIQSVHSNPPLLGGTHDFTMQAFADDEISNAVLDVQAGGNGVNLLAIMTDDQVAVTGFNKKILGGAGDSDYLLQRTRRATVSLTAMPGDFISVDTAGIVITLPPLTIFNSSLRYCVGIKIQDGVSITNANAVFVVGSGTDLIFGPGIGSGAGANGLIMGAAGSYVILLSGPTTSSINFGWDIISGAQDTGWNDVASGVGFGGFWSNLGGAYANAAFRKIGPRVFIRGQLTGTAVANSTIFTLPAGYRPPFQKLCAGYSGGSTGYIQLFTNGNVQTGTQANTNPSIDCDFLTT